MPKARPPFDMQRYQALKAQGRSQRAIAQEMGMPEATLRNNLKVLAQSIGEGIPMGNQSIPHLENSNVHRNVHPRETMVYLACPHRKGHPRNTKVHLHSMSTQVYLTMERKVLWAVVRILREYTRASLRSRH